MPAAASNDFAAHGRYADFLIAASMAALIAIVALVYALAPPPLDARGSLGGAIDQVWAALAAFAAIAGLRLLVIARAPAKGAFGIAAAMADMIVLFLLVLSFNDRYGQPAAFALKSPTMLFAFVLIGLQALSLDARRVAASGLMACAGWAGVVAFAAILGGPAAITRSYVDYLTSPTILIGAQVEIGVALLAFTAVLALVAHRSRLYLSRNLSARRGLEAALAEQAALAEKLALEAQERERANQKLNRLAHFDPLTGLENRRAFEKRVCDAARRAAAGEGPGLLVALVDLDRFRTFNDGFGRIAGDAALIGAAERLRASAPKDAALARVGADEFAVLAPCPAGADGYALAQALLHAFDEPIPTDQQAFFAGASIGAARLDPGDNPACVIAYADIALNEAKAQGRRRMVLHDPNRRGEIGERLALEAALKGAAGRGELEMVYQPIIALADGTLAGFEALMRWRHPKLGAVSPARFIPLAEETGEIVDIGAWSLVQAAKDAARFAAAGAPSGAFMSVNVSPRQLLDLTPLTAAFTLAQSHAAHLKLEVTETAIVEDPQRALAALSALRARGASLALDDFGAGASSLAQLRRYPFATLKIDQAFVRDASAPGRALLRAGVGIARALGLDSVCEGVETADDALACARAGATYGQGYHYHRPMSAQDALSLVRRRVAA